ncbi:hypothetical protein FPOAC2_00287 [Fusarium poae]
MSSLQPSGLCSRCHDIFQIRPQYGESKHFKTVPEVSEGRDLGCYICWTISHTKRWRESVLEAFTEGLEYTFQRRVQLQRFYTNEANGPIKEIPGDLRNCWFWRSEEEYVMGFREGLTNGHSRGWRQEVRYFWVDHVLYLTSFKGPDLRSDISDYDESVFSLKRHRWIGVGQAALDWVHSCNTNHPGCRPHDSLYRPTRLLKILNNEVVKLIHTLDEATGNYAALSHCWGKTQTIKLHSDTKDLLEHGIEIVSLPKSYQEAILVCLKLDIAFIWIDSLCIFQDSQDDWEREAITMQYVYGNSYLNICTAAAADSTEESFIGRSKGIIKTPRFSRTWQNNSADSCFLYYDRTLQEGIAESPLRHRGWVYQEWYLSPRSLILSHNQLWWHCREFLANEENPYGNPEFEQFDWLKVTNHIDAPYLERRPGLEEFDWFLVSNNIHTWGLTEHEGGMMRSFRLWFEHVEAYMNMNFSKESDRMIAFSGIVSSFVQSQKLTGTYLVGLWRPHLPLGLCWYVKDSKTSRSSRYMAPSWTWTSLLGPYQLGHIGHLDSFRLGKPGLLTTLESAPAASSDSSIKVTSITDGAITVHDNIIGPVSFAMQEGTIYLVDECNGERFEDPYFDENDEDGPLITSMDSRPFERGRGAVIDVVRQVERLNDYAGSLYILPIGQMPSLCQVYSLILYQPLHESSVFFRVGHTTSTEMIAARGFHYRITQTPTLRSLVTIL